MAKPALPKTPIFITKLLDATLVEQGIKLPAIMVDSPILNWRKSLLDTLPNITDMFIVNPVTHKILYKEARDGANFKKIGYPDMEPENLYSDATFRREQLVKRSIEDQIAKKATIIIAPFLYAEDTDDTKFSLNLTLLADTIHYFQENKIDKPLYAMIHIGNNVLRRPVLINHIIDRYKDDFDANIDGFFLNINDLDCEKADFEVLAGLANLVFRLSEFKPIFVKRIGAFGEVLCTAGTSGFSSGLGIGESSSVKNLTASEEEKKRKFLRRTYIPEIFDYVNDEEAKKIGYTCDCQSCSGKLPTDEKSKKLHILYTRLEVTATLQKLSPEQKIQCIKDRLNKALKLIKKYQDEFGSPFKTAHIVKWIGVLDAIKEWKHSKEDDAELDSLLKEIDANQ